MVSVINKMLRDLDQRQAPVPAGAVPSGPVLRPAAVAAPVPVSSGWMGLGLGVLVLGGLGVVGWLWQQGALTRLEVGTTVAVHPAPAVVAPVPQAPSSQAVALPLPAVSAPQSDAPVLSAPAALAEPALTPARVGELASVALRLDASLRSYPARASELAAPKSEPKAVSAPVTTTLPAPAPPSVGVPVVPDAAQLAQRQLQASKDAILQAQNLWSAGSRDAAIGLLQDVVAAAERAGTSSAMSASGPLLWAPVRELTRMQLVQGQAQAAWDLLTRLEPLLVNQPDLWAVRANAAQRLGRHQDSVHAYMMALQSRPQEQRWMLGAAVSLAALGQTKSAADMADKARAAGPVRTEVLTYLRQMGVPLKD